MNKLLALFKALQYGASLPNPEIHKNRQNLLNALIGLFGAIAIFLPVEVTADDVANIAGGIASVVGLYNLYATTATTEKIGLPPPIRADTEPMSSGSVREANDSPLDFTHRG